MIKGSLLALLLCGKGLIGRVVDVPAEASVSGSTGKKRGKKQ